MHQPHPSEASALSGVSDRGLVALIAGALFVLAAWPLLLVDLPPFQDLPNHVASAHIAAHPELYPEFTFNGLLKSNALLTLWLELLGGQGLFGAARVFTALVLAVTAFALPSFVLHFAGRRALPVAACCFWPLVHNFPVVMGFLNFAFAFALSLILLTVIDRQRTQPSWGRGARTAALACLIWYAHPFPLMVVVGLVALDAATVADGRARWRAGLTRLAPLAPALLLSIVSAQRHLAKADNATTETAATFSYLNPAEIVLHLWTDVSGAFTRWGSMTIVPALLLAFFMWRRRRQEPPLFSRLAMAVLAIGYVALPVMLSNWSYFNCRLVPFLWVGALLRLPNTFPRPVAIGLCACALSFSVVTGADYVRLDRDRAAFTAGLHAVPRRAQLLPLLFEHRRTSKFTASLTHAWGYYTVMNDTAAPLVFAVERSYPITYRDFPPRAVIPPALDRLAETNATPARTCKALGHSPIDDACTAAWRDVWSTFWREAEPRFTHVLTWAMPPETRAIIPGRYERVFSAGDLEIYARPPREY
jgi:hypothetical protein